MSIEIAKYGYNETTLYHKKLILHNFSFLCKEMFADYFYADKSPSSDEGKKYKKIKSIGIKVDGDETNTYFPFADFNKFNENTMEVPNAKGLYTYPELNLRYNTKSNKSNNLWNDVFEYEEHEKEVITYDEDEEYEVIPIDLYTKICGVKKKYPFSLNHAEIFTSERKNCKLQRSLAPCVVEDCSGENQTLYLVLNDANCNMVCGGICEFINIDPTDIKKYWKIIIPNNAIKNTGITCDKTQCSNCNVNDCNQSGNCNVIKIDLNEIFFFYKNNENKWVSTDFEHTPMVKYYYRSHPVIKMIDIRNIMAQIIESYPLNLLDNFDFYLVVKKSFDIDENNKHYEVICPEKEFYKPDKKEYVTLKEPYGYLRFDNKGNKIVRKYFSRPNEWYIPFPTMFFMSLVFIEDTDVQICNYFQIEYDYWLPKEVYMSITKDSEIKTYVSFNNTYKNDELLLGSVEIPPKDFVPSYDSTLNINESDHRGITDIRHDKLINDNHQRIKFDEISNQTNRQGLTASIRFSYDL